MAVGDIAQVRVVGTFVGQAVNAVWHFQFKTGTATLAALLSQLEASTTTFRDMHIAGGSANLSWTELQGQMLIPYGAASQILAISPVWVGADASNPMPPQACMVATKRTDLIGRSRRGRVYFPGWGVAANFGDGRWTTAAVAARQGAVNTFGAEYGDGGLNADFEAGVWSRKIAGPTPPYSVAGFEAIDTMVVRDVVRTQRRRQRGIGA